MYFCGDIIILDPINIAKNDDWQLILDEDTDQVKLEKIGIDKYLVFESEESSAQVYDGKGGVIGEFCSDSGLCCILLFEDLI